MEIVDLISNLGFPIVMSLLLMSIVDKKLDEILQILKEIKVNYENERKDKNDLKN